MASKPELDILVPEAFWEFLVNYAEENGVSLDHLFISAIKDYALALGFRPDVRPDVPLKEQVLAFLAHGPSTVSTIAKTYNKNKTTVRSCLVRLEKDGRTKREIHPDKFRPNHTNTVWLLVR